MRVRTTIILFMGICFMVLNITACGKAKMEEQPVWKETGSTHPAGDPSVDDPSADAPSAGYPSELSAWSDDLVYQFMAEVDELVRSIPAETDSRDTVISQYEQYFSSELSGRIFDSLYVERDGRWVIPEGDGGYLFIPPDPERNQVSILRGEDFIVVEETYDDWMYSKVRFTIRHDGKPLITEWIMDPDDAAEGAESGQAEDDKPAAAVQATPFIVPEGYMTVSASGLQFAVPNGWTMEKIELADSLIFYENGEKVGETDVWAWFDEETWMNYKPNHSEQTEFAERTDLWAGFPELELMDVRIYRIGLIHTKPAASLDPDWKYEDVRWYVASGKLERPYGFFFARELVDETTMETIVASVRFQHLISNP